MNSTNTNPPAVRIFSYEGKDVRTTEINGEPWFVAKDVADILEIANHRDAIQALDEDEKRVSKIPTPSNGGYSSVNLISEAGLYTLLMRSNKKEAKPFRRWVTHEVLPSIRRTGSYSVPALRDENNDKPAVPQEEKQPYMSRARFSAVNTIISKALSCKKEEDFQKVIALDRVFTKQAGYSALEAAGLSLSIKRKEILEIGVQSDTDERFYKASKWEAFSFEWKHDLPSLPETAYAGSTTVSRSFLVNHLLDTGDRYEI